MSFAFRTDPGRIERREMEDDIRLAPATVQCVVRWIVSGR